MFQRVDESRFIPGEHEVLRFWEERGVFRKLLEQNRGKPKWSFLDGPITANNPMGVHHAWGRTYKDAYQRFFAMTGRQLRYQNGFDCQGLWVEVEVEKELGLGTKNAIGEYGVDKFVRACKQRVLRFAARQTEQSVRLGYWMEWDDPEELRKLAEHIGSDQSITLQTPKGDVAEGTAEELTAQLGNPQWGGSYFTFATENNETIWTFLKKCFTRGKIYRGHDVMPWSGRGGSAYSQMEVADGRKLTTHRSCFVRFPIRRDNPKPADGIGGSNDDSTTETRSHGERVEQEYLLIWTTTPWTLTSNVAAAVNPDLDYVKLRAKRDGAVYYFAQDNLDYKRLEKEFKEGFGGDWAWPEGVPKLKTIAQIFKEQGGYEIEGTLKGKEMERWRYVGPFDDLGAQASTQTRQSSASPHAKWLLKSWDRKYLFAREHIRLEFQSFDDFENPERDAWTAYDQRIASLDGRTDEGAVDEAYEARGTLDVALSGVALQLSANIRRAIRTLMRIARAHGVFGVEVPTADRLDRYGTLLERLGIDVFGLTAWITSVDFECVAYQLANVGSRLSDWDTQAKSAIESLRRIGIVEESKQGHVLFPRGFSSAVHHQHSELLEACAREIRDLPHRSSSESHRVIDGGRDNKGNPHVVAGEGTGIVHIAPGCGDIDHKIGVELGLPVIAPLQEDGTYGEGFGDFTGREAIAPETADLVFEQLKEKGYLVYVETYPHIYPHCWRTGDELVFRLVDEWFINMDWRDEIKAVTKAIEWLPDSIQGQERELEWLTTMRDWMISKKRFWGLALPIWIDPDDPSDFEVVGSLAELKERALDGGEGWDEFEGHTPHKPWIDKVKIRSQKTGKLLSRIEDVGNPWLDAGIVPFSTLNYNEWKRKKGPGFSDKGLGTPVSLDTGPSTLDDTSTLNSQLSTLNWPNWFPADLVTECFPGQFRNWFYSLLSLATMMRYDETEDPEEKKPFKTLLGHRLVMDEHGNAMHKSDGTAIWFEEAAEQLGVDTLRWMYLAHNPASDLRFGLRHPDEPVTLETPEGPISETKEGLPTCKVTSTPADEIRRQVLIPLWNSYAFFVNYAVLDGFDPSLEPVPLADRPEIDRWILSRLQELTQTAHESFEAFDAPRFMQAAAEYIDDLSNWYIRRNRRRFWRARQSPGVATPGPSDTAWDPDKLAAYQTLYEVLVTLTKLLAPAIPFLTERMYQNLVAPPDDVASDDSQLSTLNSQLPESVHLCPYPEVDSAKLDPDLNWKAHQVQLLVRLGHRLRELSEQRVRQPLAELRFACREARQAAALEEYAAVVADELNVKQVTRADNLDDLVSYTYKPNLKTLGPKYGKLLGAIRKELPSLDPALLAPLRSDESVTVEMGGESVTLEPDDVMVSTAQATDWASADDAGIQVALSTKLTPELIREGMARDLIRHVQQMRKDANLEENGRITIGWSAEGDASETVSTMLSEWSETICTETRADGVSAVAAESSAKSVSVGEVAVTLTIGSPS